MIFLMLLEECNSTKPDIGGSKSYSMNIEDTSFFITIIVFIIEFLRFEKDSDDQLDCTFILEYTGLSQSQILVTY